PDRLQDHVLTRRPARVLTRYHALVDEQLHHALVARHLAEPAVAQEIAARVADFGDIRLGAANHHRGERRAHAVAIASLRSFVHFAIGAMHGVFELAMHGDLRVLRPLAAERLEHERT